MITGFAVALVVVVAGVCVWRRLRRPTPPKDSLTVAFLEAQVTRESPEERKAAKARARLTAEHLVLAKLARDRVAQFRVLAEREAATNAAAADAVTEIIPVTLPGDTEVIPKVPGQRKPSRARPYRGLRPRESARA